MKTRFVINRNRILVALLVAAFSGTPLKAAFQESLWGARPASMAGVFTALADDANAPSYNPAGIALLQRTEVTMMYAQLFTGVDLHAGADKSQLGLGYFSFVPQIQDKRFGSYGFSWTNFVASNLYREDTFTLTAADARSFDRDGRETVLAYGANLKLLKRTFTASPTNPDPVFASGGESDAVTADLGVIARPNFDILPGLKIGLSGQNITSPDIGLHETDRVPARYALGLAYQDLKYQWFNPAVDVSRRDGKTLVGAAWEGWFAKNALAFRFGGDRTQLAGGLGYQFLIRSVVVRFDYAILWPLQVEGTSGSHRLSLTTSF
jgi:hypothetical protein